MASSSEIILLKSTFDVNGKPFSVKLTASEINWEVISPGRAASGPYSEPLVSKYKPYCQCRLLLNIKEERDKRYLPYIELGHWLCSHFQLETLLNFHKPINRKLYNLEK